MVTELDASAAGSIKVLGAVCANACSMGAVSRMAALNAATSGTVVGS